MTEKADLTFELALKRIQEELQGKSGREYVLEEARRAVMQDRNNTHGDPEDNFRDIADFWNTYLGDWINKPIKSHDVAAMMILVKVARLRHSPTLPDHWIDIIGYGACGFETAK